VASLSQGRTAAAQCGLFTHKSVPVIFEPPCINWVVDSLTVFLNNTLRNSIGRLIRESDLVQQKISSTETTMRKSGV